jgi:hypothetical protein
MLLSIITIKISMNPNHSIVVWLLMIHCQKTMKVLDGIDNLINKIHQLIRMPAFYYKMTNKAILSFKWKER